MFLRLAVLTLLAVFSVTIAADEMVKWVYHAPYGSAVYIDCNTSSTMDTGPDTANEVHWILNNGDEVKANWASHDGNLRTIDEGKILYIDRVKTTDTGFYHCVLITDKARLLVKRALNIFGPQWSNFDKVVKDGAIVGGIAAAVVLVAASGLCLVYNFRYIDPAERQAKKERKEEAERERKERKLNRKNKQQQETDVAAVVIVTDGVDNEALELDDVKVEEPVAKPAEEVSKPAEVSHVATVIRAPSPGIKRDDEERPPSQNFEMPAYLPPPGYKPTPTPPAIVTTPPAPGYPVTPPAPAAGSTSYGDEELKELARTEL